MLYALLSSFLLILSFIPFPSHWVFVLCAFVPLMVGIERGRIGVIHVWIAGLLFWFSVLYWIPRTLNSYGHTGWPVAIAAYVALSLYLSLYFLLWGLWGRLVGWRALPFALAYVPLEWLRYRLIYGFPFFMLSHALADAPWLIQLAYPMTQWGADLSVVLFNWGLSSKRRLWLPLMLVAANLALWFSYTPPSLGVKVAIVQPNLGEREKWDPKLKKRNMALVQEMVKRACSSGVDLVVAPETTLPFIWGVDAQTFDFLKGVSGCPSHILMGVLAYKDGYINRAVLIHRGSVVAHYDKRILVPFGEFVPWRGIIGRVLKIALPADFRRGGTPPLLTFDHRTFFCGICYEMAFPHYIRRYRGRFQFMVNITNDAWFGRTIAPYMHLWSAVVRAVENRSYLIRSANSGISAVVDPKGRILLETPLFERGVWLYR